jgi:hypothetical protein
MEIFTVAAPSSRRARRVLRELRTVSTLAWWFFDFTVEGDRIVATPYAGGPCICTYSFGKGWGPVRINDFLMARVEDGE